ncbi:MaoC family dehydratase N-terminal domain-containing protein [Geminicoccaceae bacterium 1502E]|nr:MaoC family dehydratase N-terminal domain-containing protein [Geminicoccaceae bacterium 1502E]
MSLPDTAPFAAWIDREEVSRLSLDPWPAAALTAALDRDDPPGPGAPLPPFWHHLYGLPVVRAAATGPDGHAARGGFLPPVPLARRMWAGGRLAWTGPLPVGAEVTRRSTVRSITAKEGRQGPLVFVLVEHRFETDRGLALVEEHDIVYREAPSPDAPQAEPPRAPEQAAWQQAWLPDEVMLFRYSALTYNGHRIHYDDRYVREVEGYPGLIVHGPLLATFLLDLVRRARPDATVARFEFRALAPVFAGRQLVACGTPDTTGAALWIADAKGAMVMRGRADFAAA